MQNAWLPLIYWVVNFQKIYGSIKRGLKSLIGSCSFNIVPMQIFVLSRFCRKSHFCYYGKCHYYWKGQGSIDCMGYWVNKTSFEGWEWGPRSYPWMPVWAISFLYLIRFYLIMIYQFLWGTYNIPSLVIDYYTRKCQRQSLQNSNSVGGLLLLEFLIVNYQS